LAKRWSPILIRPKTVLTPKRAEFLPPILNLGQFIDHDLTFDPASSLQQQDDPDGLVDFRTPRFDLDCVYGKGPDDAPYLYTSDGRFIQGRPLAARPAIRTLATCPAVNPRTQRNQRTSKTLDAPSSAILETMKTLSFLNYKGCFTGSTTD
jgi:hypothetical protein